MEILTVHSAQKRDVTQRLLRGEVHIPRWADSAACNLSNRYLRHQHKRAYIWMAKQFELRVGEALYEAPFWFGFDYDTIVAMNQAYGRSVTEDVLTLDVPKSQCLLSMYDPWPERILEGHCLTCIPPRIRTSETCGCVGRIRRATWENIFTLSDNPNEWQGITGLVRPDCLKAVNGKLV